LKPDRIPTKICLGWRENLSPLGALPIIKQGLGENQQKGCREIGEKREKAKLLLTNFEKSVTIIKT